MASIEEVRLANLRAGNDIRTTRAKALAEVRAGQLTPQEAVDHPDLQGVTVERLVRNIPFSKNPMSRQALRPKHPGGSRRARVVRVAMVEANTRLAYLSKRQRQLLLEQLNELPMFRGRTASISVESAA